MEINKQSLQMISAVRNKKKLWLIGIPLALVGFLSLSSWREAKDKFGTSDYVSELIKAYNTLNFYGGHGSLYTMNETTTDEIVIPQRGGDWFDGGEHIRAHQHQYVASDAKFNNAWQNLYSGVVSCNKQLFQYSKITTSGVNIYKAELRVLRAWYYYLLLDAFRNVPLIVDYFPTSPGLPSANTSAQLYNFIESEITSSLPDLSVAPIYGRFNQSAAKAVLAKLYLNANVYISQTKWNETVTMCDDIINSGYYNLTPDFFTSFYPNNNASPEIIFQIPYDEVALQGFNMAVMTLHPASQATFSLKEQPWNGYSAIEDFYNSFEATDGRKGQFLTGTQRDTVTHVPVTDPAFDDPDGAVLNYTPAINALFPNAYRQAGARIHKWKYQLGASFNLNNDFAIFRYSDILLMKAEAKLNLGDAATALTLVNQIRTRAGLSTWGSLTFSDLLAERGREFFAEAWRRQDLIRLGAYNNAWWQKSASPAYVKVFPIPAPQITANPNLVQNPGY